MMSKCSIVVVNYASSDLLRRNLVQTSRSSPSSSIVVVDNFSTDAERDAVRSLCAENDWTLIDPPTNGGFGAGMNLGVARAFEDGADQVLMLNPDAQIERDAISELSRAVSDAGFSIASPLIVDSEGRTWFAGADVYIADGRTRGRGKRAERPDEERWEWLSGACMLVPRDVWRATGGFSEKYFLYWEDVDFSRRAADSGAELLVVESAVAIHDEGGTQTSTKGHGHAKSLAYYYYNIRNRMMFAADHLDAAGIRRWDRGLWRSAKEILLRGGRRQFLNPLPPVRAALRGVRDGRALARAAIGATSGSHASSAHSGTDG